MASPNNPAPTAPLPVIVLVRPQLGENIGMTARAMANCGLRELRLVAPRDPWPNSAAAAAAGRNSAPARAVLEEALCFASLEEAVRDLVCVWATSARGRGFTQRVETPEAAAAGLLAAGARGEASGILFGPERTGLENDDILWAGRVIRAPLAEGAESLNLAQSVLLVAWCWRRARDAVANAPAPAPAPVAGAATGAATGAAVGAAVGAVAPSADREALAGFLARLDAALVRADYYPATATAESMRRNLRSFFVRAAPNVQEVRSLEGVLRALEARRAKRHAPRED